MNLAVEASSQDRSLPGLPKGVGLGLRPSHYAHVLDNRPSIPWFEVISENYMGIGGRSGGRSLAVLDAVRANYPLALHGVSMSIGSTDPLKTDYLRQLKDLMLRVEPAWVSDHFCWTGVEGENLHDLLPLPYTEEAVHHLVSRIQYVQDFLGRPFVLENVSTYLSFSHSEMSEWEFIAEVSKRSGCGLLLDVNNVYVSSVNHGFDPMKFLRFISPERVVQMHLAGYSEQENHLLDTHDHPVSDPVWALYSAALRIFGPKPTLIEWDAEIPEFSVLESEMRKAQAIIQGGV